MFLNLNKLLFYDQKKKKKIFLVKFLSFPTCKSDICAGHMCGGISAYAMKDRS